MRTAEVRDAAMGSIIHCEHDSPAARKNSSGEAERHKCQIAPFHWTISAAAARARSATPAYAGPSQLVGLYGSSVHARCPVGCLVLPSADARFRPQVVSPEALACAAPSALRLGGSATGVLITDNSHGIAGSGGDNLNHMLFWNWRKFTSEHGEKSFLAQEAEEITPYKWGHPEEER